MSELLTVALDVLAEMGQSDADGHVPHPIYSWLATSGAHLAIGMALGLWHDTRARPRVVVTFFALWAAKELYFDLPRGNWSLLTWADSFYDLAIGAIGLLSARSAIGRNVDTLTYEELATHCSGLVRRECK